MGRSVEQYLHNWRTCQRCKHTSHALHGLLKSLPVSHRPWKHVGMNFVAGLLESDGYNTILVSNYRLINQNVPPHSMLGYRWLGKCGKNIWHKSLEATLVTRLGKIQQRVTVDFEVLETPQPDPSNWVLTFSLLLGSRRPNEKSKHSHRSIFKGIYILPTGWLCTVAPHDWIHSK